MSLTPEQLAERVNYLGATDAAAVLGMSRYKTALDVWGEKTGKIKPEDISMRLPIRAGTELEGLVGKLFTEETGKEVGAVIGTMTHKRYPFIRANLDFLVIEEKVYLEAKTASGWKAHEWEENKVPPEYAIQCLHQMAVTGSAYCYLACLIGGNQAFRWVRIDRDQSTIDKIIAKEVEFWEKFVVPGVMPTTISAKDNETLFKLFPDGIVDEEPLILGEDANRLADSIMAMVADRVSLEKVIETEKNRIKAMLGSHALGMTDRFSFSWKNQKTSRFDIKRAEIEIYETVQKYTKETESRVLRISELKSGG